jgi:hypothetical protein
VPSTDKFTAVNSSPPHPVAPTCPKGVGFAPNSRRGLESDMSWPQNHSAFPCRILVRSRE